MAVAPAARLIRVAGPQPNMPQPRSNTVGNCASVAASNPRIASIRRRWASTTANPLPAAVVCGDVSSTAYSDEENHRSEVCAMVSRASE
jgi:hypothetical protein